MYRQLIGPLKVAMKRYLPEIVAPNSFTIFRHTEAAVLALTPAVSAGIHTSSAHFLGRKLRKESKSTFDRAPLTASNENASVLELHQPGWDSSRFPDLTLPSRVFNGIMYKDLPIVDVKAHKNNTIFSVSDPTSTSLAGIIIRSCGYDGFKNARKSTNVAAQATGFTFGKKMAQRGFRTVRVRVNGLGNGRLASLKGISLAGIEIVSITDSTPVSWNPPRARKRRRV